MRLDWRDIRRFQFIPEGVSLQAGRFLTQASVTIHRHESLALQEHFPRFAGEPVGPVKALRFIFQVHSGKGLRVERLGAYRRLYSSHSVVIVLKTAAMSLSDRRSIRDNPR